MLFLLQSVLALVTFLFFQSAVKVHLSDATREFHFPFWPAVISPFEIITSIQEHARDYPKTP
jgi:hypothetical protein